MPTITPRQLHERLQQGENLPLLDVRTPAEHAAVHVPDVHLVSLDRLDATTLSGVTPFAKDKPLYIFCRSGERAQRAADKLAKHGYQQCHIVEGGMTAWAEAGLPVIQGTSKIISLERQVRIAAGTMVLTGLLLAHFAHPAFIWLSGFVGTGLIFAGITDWCGMGMLIARAPWNQRASTAGSDSNPAR
jgi:rhodanese-related sulfurtransferase